MQNFKPVRAISTALVATQALEHKASRVIAGESSTGPAALARSGARPAILQKAIDGRATAWNVRAAVRTAAEPSPKRIDLLNAINRLH